MIPILHYLLIERTLRQYFRVISTPVRPNPPGTRRPTIVSPVDANDPSSTWRLYAHYYFPLFRILGMRSSTDYCYAFTLFLDCPLLIQLYSYCRLRICTFWALVFSRPRYINTKPRFAFIWWGMILHVPLKPLIVALAHCLDHNKCLSFAVELIWAVISWVRYSNYTMIGWSYGDTHTDKSHYNYY